MLFSLFFFYKMYGLPKNPQRRRHYTQSLNEVETTRSQALSNPFVCAIVDFNA